MAASTFIPKRRDVLMLREGSLLSEFNSFHDWKGFVAAEWGMKSKDTHCALVAIRMQV